MTLASSLAAQEDRLMNCVHCGFCLPACPTYVRLGDEADSPRGRLYLMRAVAEGRLAADSDAFQIHIDRCLGCRACEPVCPAGVEYGSLLERAREAATEARPAPVLPRLMLWVFSRKWATALSMAAGRVFRATGIPGLGVRLLPRSLGRIRLGLGMLASTGRRGATSGAVRATGSARPRAGATSAVSGEASSGPRTSEHDQAPQRTRVAILDGCVQAGLFGQVNDATRRVLEANGMEVVDVADQGCCGALHSHGGQLEGARALARRNIAAFEAAGVERIAVNAAGCGTQLEEYGELLEDDPAYAARAAAISLMSADVTELLADAGPRSGASLPVQVTYDAPCHLLYGQGVADAPLVVLRAIPNLDLVPLRGSSECCGGAGIYGITHPELGGQIGQDKVSAVMETGASVVATGNPGCMMQIGAGLLMEGSGVEARHPVELLDRSYRAAGFYDVDVDPALNAG